MNLDYSRTKVKKQSGILEILSTLVLATLISFGFSSEMAAQQVVYQNHVTGTNNSGLTLPVASGLQDMLVIVVAAKENCSDNNLGLTLSNTQIATSCSDSDGDSDPRITAYYIDHNTILSNVSGGNLSINWSHNNDIAVTAILYSGVNQATPFGNPNTNSGGSSSTASVQVSSPGESGAYVFGAFTNDDEMGNILNPGNYVHVINGIGEDPSLAAAFGDAHSSNPTTVQVNSSNGDWGAVGFNILPSVPVPAVPVADFIAEQTIVPVGKSIKFTDLSTGVPDEWNWDFPGGTPSSSTDQHPTVVYNTPGVYTVSLTVENTLGDDTETKVDYITVEGFPFIDNITMNNGSSGNATVNAPADLNEDDLILVILSDRDGPDITPPSGFQLIILQRPGSAGQNSDSQVAAYWKLATDSESGPYSFVRSTNREWRAVAMRVIGHDPADPIGSFNGNANSGNGNNITVTGFNTQEDNALLIAALSTHNTISNINVPASMDQEWADGSPRPGHAGSSERINNQGPTGDKTFSWTTDRSRSAILFEINALQACNLSATVDDEDISCYGEEDGSITISNASGATNYEFSIDGGDNWQTGNTFSGLEAGMYEVFIRDADNTDCEVDLGTVTIDQPSEIEINLVGLEHETCPDAEDGFIEVSATGGTGTLSYLWSNAETTATIEDLTAGTYFVTVTDENDCTATESYVINTTHSNPVVDCPADFEVCINDGLVDLDALVDPVGGDFDGDGVSGSDFNPGVAGIGSHDITYEFTDGNGCTNSCDFEITVNALPAVSCPDPLIDICENAPPFPLTGASPDDSGEYSGNGVDDNEFDPTTAGIGGHIITYTYMDPTTECINSCTLNITVVACFTISGNIYWVDDMNIGMEGVTVELSGEESDNVITDGNGYYEFHVNSLGDYVITPSKETGLLNGVDVSDALLIQQHITFINRLTDPYRLIAADINKDEIISTFDALIIRQALLNNPAAVALFANSWTFVPENYVFPDSLNPWGHPESIDLNDLQMDTSDLNFIGIKMGDLNGDADPENLIPSIPSRNQNANLLWRAVDAQWEEYDSEIEVTFKAGYFQEYAAYQFGLQFDPQVLEFVEVTTTGPLNLSENHFGAYQADQGELRGAWYSSSGAAHSLAEDTEVFTLRFRSLTASGSVSDHLWLNDAIIPALVFDENLLRSGMEIEFMEDASVSVRDLAQGEFALFQNRPNPFRGETVIGFVLPEAGESTLRIVDISGKEVYRTTGQFPGGENELTIPVTDLASGIYFYQLITDSGTLVKRMVVR